MAFTMTLNGVQLPIKIKQVEGRGPFTQDVTAQEIPGMAGAYFVGRKIKTRLLKVYYNIDDAIDSASLRDKVNNINNLLNTDGPKEIIFSDEAQTKYTKAIINGENPFNDKYVSLVDGELNFICFDPYKYLITQTTKQLTSGSLTAVLPTLNSIKADSAIPIIDVVFTGAATEYKITKTETGEYVRIIYNFIANDHLIVDLNTRKVTINNITQMNTYDVNNSPFILTKDTNTFTIGQLGVSTTTLKYNARFL
jgi:predicted phage tail component-like protein